MKIFTENPQNAHSLLTVLLSFPSTIYSKKSVRLKVKNGRPCFCGKRKTEQNLI